VDHAGEAAGALLARPGAVPRLLNLLAHSSSPDRLGEGLTAAAAKVEMTQAALLEDIRLTIGLACPDLPSPSENVACSLCPGLTWSKSQSNEFTCVIPCSQ
jgi:hypothetical protein